MKLTEEQREWAQQYIAAVRRGRDPIAMIIGQSGHWLFSVVEPLFGGLASWDRCLVVATVLQSWLNQSGEPNPKAD